MPHIFNTASRCCFGCLKTRTPTFWKMSCFDALTTQLNQTVPANHPIQESSAVLYLARKSYYCPIETMIEYRSRSGTTGVSPSWDPRLAQGSVSSLESPGSPWLWGGYWGLLSCKRNSMKDDIHAAFDDRYAKNS
jgi:hypothetical protein